MPKNVEILVTTTQTITETNSNVNSELESNISVGSSDVSLIESVDNPLRTTIIEHSE
jgi:hypothetical protein